jgi:hypothetical protein
VDPVTALELLRDAIEWGHWTENGSNVHAHTDEAALMLADEFGMSARDSQCCAYMLLTELEAGA